MLDSPAAESEDAAAWEAFNGAIAAARAELMAAAPDAGTAIEAEAYLMRVAASALGDGFLGDHFRSGGLTRAIPTRGGPNPDYIMGHAAIDPARRYRLEGRLNDSERAGVGLYAVGADGKVLLAGYAAFDRSKVDADGGFRLDLAADAEGPGGLAIPPNGRVLIVRLLHRSAGAPCCLSFSGGAAPPPLTPATGTTAGALTLAGRTLLASVRQFLVWSALIGEARNRFITPPERIAEEVQGDPDTGYYFAYYDLAPGEWLEALMPPAVTGYWSLHAYNHWCESLPSAGTHDLSARADADGRIRVRIGPDAPADLVNRVDTLGRRRGVLIYRTLGETQTRIPEAAVRNREA
ncbi:hypothetical protein LJR225_001062 [Phenylobacterium sp. LjRoot225]|uniref:hypothetical protein n=1 Tax=Phenylobacterium sp. LjRoot225 TaxID=3342285 RepID=UPI003ED04733